jgi:hypothetical protein
VLFIGGPLVISLLAWGVDWIGGLIAYQSQQHFEFAIREAK